MSDKSIGNGFERIATPPQLGDYLRTLRGRRTQQSLADRAKRANLYLHRPDVSTIERGRRLPTENELRGFLHACERTDLFEPLNAVRSRLLEDHSNEPLRSAEPEPQAVPSGHSAGSAASAMVAHDRRWAILLIGVGAVLSTGAILGYQLLSDPPISGPPSGTLEAVVGEMPLPNCPTCVPGGETFTQQASGVDPHNTFRDPRAFKGRGIPVMPGQQVEVVCRFHDPEAPLSVQPGWWYLIASPPWNREFYTVANSYRNGDPPNLPPGEDGTPVDVHVPVC